MDMFSLAAGGAIGLVAGFFLARLLGGKAGISPEQHEKTIREQAALAANCESLSGQLAEAKAVAETLRADNQQLRQDTTQLAEQKRTLDERVSQHKADMEAMQKQIATQFENLANKIFMDKSAHFKKESGEHLSGLLTPMRERLGEFQKKFEESFGSHAKEQYSLKTEIKRIVEANEKITLQADNLTRALKGDVKAQGNWGEVMLERILEESGLRRGEDYILQGANMGLKHPEDGRTQKPDVVVKLPEGKHIIIDAKVSLTHYERFIEAEEAEKPAYLQQYLQSMRNHVKGLEERRYQDTDGLGTPDFVLMFVPVEGAYSLAIQSDGGLHSFAWEKKVVLVCPATLYATLKTVASIWRLELQNRNAEEIAKRGGELYDKFHGFITEMEQLGGYMKKASDSYEKAFDRLSRGRGNMVRQVEMLRDLGAKASKTLKPELLEIEEAEADSEVALEEV